MRIDDQILSLQRSAERTAQGDEGDRVTITGNSCGGGDEEDANRSDSNGGALAVYVSAPVTLADNAFSGNAGTFYGGADVTFCGTATVTANTFEHNVVAASGPPWRARRGAARRGRRGATSGRL